MAEHDPARGCALAGDALREVAAQLREVGAWAARQATEIECRAGAYDIALRSATSIERDLRKRLAEAERRIAEVEAEMKVHRTNSYAAASAAGCAPHDVPKRIAELEDERCRWFEADGTVTELPPEEVVLRRRWAAAEMGRMRARIAELEAVTDA